MFPTNCSVAFKLNMGAMAGLSGAGAPFGVEVKAEGESRGLPWIHFTCRVFGVCCGFDAINIGCHDCDLEHTIEPIDGACGGHDYGDGERDGDRRDFDRWNRGLRY